MDFVYNYITRQKCLKVKKMGIIYTNRKTSLDSKHACCRGQNVEREFEMKKENKKQIKLWILFCGIAIATLIGIHIEGNRTHTLQQGIATEIIRFHVLANSDSEEDQGLKRKVKDEVVAFMQEKLKNVTKKEQAEQVIKEYLGEIKNVAEKVTKREGNGETVTTALTKKDFPVKVYGDTVFPAGKYETLQIEIGNAKGKNWWCVMFPSLCMVDESYTVVPKEAKKKLKEHLTEEEYESIQMEQNSVKYRLKIVEIWDNLWD